MIVNVNDIKLIWHDDYYDGPLSGACSINGKKYYFKISHEHYNTNTRVRIFSIIDLGKEEWRIITNDHLLFRRFVGEHCDYTDDGKTLKK